MSLAPFADRLTESTHACGVPLCVGIDPHLDLIPKHFRVGNMEPHAEATAKSVRDFCFELLKCVKGKVGVVKPQSAMFEVLGARGVELLADFNQEAQAEGLLVILDAKRGDIGSTSEAYAKALLGRDAAIPSDALTVNPFLGLETLSAFTERARTTNSGIFILLRTSNPGAQDIQGMISDDGRPLFIRLAEKLKPLIEASEGKCGFSSIGVVVGATWHEEAKHLREILPSALFLIPGFGAQGGSPEEALIGLKHGSHGYEGGVVNSARAIIFPKDAAEASNHSDWKQAIDSALNHNINALRK